MADPFAVHRPIRVRDSAVVVCARRRRRPRSEGGGPRRLTPADVAPESAPSEPASEFLRALMGSAGEISFDSDWEVLLGQATVVNWLKTTPRKLRFMRYGGEWKLAGGNVDPGESVADAARRELHEEFLAPLRAGVPPLAAIRLRPFCTKQTRPVRGVSNLMHCFVALEDENSWLAQLDVAEVNAGLERRRRRFAAQSWDEAAGMPSADFFEKPPKQREEITPEVQAVAWLPLCDAVRHTLSSMVPGTRVNAYQDRAFAKYGRKRRDPMFITGAVLMELEGFPSAPALVEYCAGVSLADLTREEQWLFDGMDAEAVASAFRERTEHQINPSFKSPEVIARLKLERRRRGASRL
jgi:8-oxo-dGTP pyrophosphatase MutT (NUDIX family)